MINFFIPYSYVVNFRAITLDNFWKTLVEYDRCDNTLQQRNTQLSHLVWIVQTYLHLQAKGFPCKLVHEIPKEGVIIAHTWNLNKNTTPTKDRIFVAIQTEKEEVNPLAHFHIVQNKKDPLFYNPYKRYFSAVYLRHWPQPDLIPRDPKRGSRLENFTYKGRQADLDYVIKEMIEGMKFSCEMAYSPILWPDYSKVDCVVAIRGFGYEYPRKPPTKLFNAWLAGIPAIVGKESAYQGEKMSDLDYLEAGSLEELRDRIVEVRDNPDLRVAMVENGRKRAKEVAPDAIAQDWINFLLNQAVPAFEQWKSYPSIREAFLRTRKFASRL